MKKCLPLICYALLASAIPSHAALVTRAVNVTLTATPDGPNQTYNLDLNQDGTTDFTFTTIIGDTANPTTASFTTIDHPFGSPNAYVIDAFTGDGFPTVSRLAPGTVITTASRFSGPNDQGNLFFIADPDPATGNFINASGTIGLRFDTPSGTLLGYADITVTSLFDPVSPLALTIHDVGYETVAGDPITTVPEPMTASLLGFAAGGLLLVRRRRVSAR